MPYTEHSSLIAAPGATADAALRYILGRKDASRRRANGYTDSDVKKIVDLYWSTATPVGLDSVLCVAQMVHETGGLTSYWSARPRRNGSGYGKTGRSSEVDPHDPKRWYEVRKGYWEEGCVFPSWEISIQAQIGRLLAYCYLKDHLTPVQRELVILADSWRPISPAIYASAPTLKPLGAMHNPRNANLSRNRWTAGWAWPGDDYGLRIAEIATAITALA